VFAGGPARRDPRGPICRYNSRRTGGAIIGQPGTATRNKGRARAALAWVGSLSLLGFLAFTTDFPAALEAFRTTDYVLFTANAILATLAAFLVDTFTVRHLLGAVGTRVGAGEFLRVKGASYLLNIVNYNLALVLMAAVVKRRTARGWGAAGSPFVLLNFVDLAVFGALTLAAIGSGASPLGPGPTRWMVLFGIGAVAGVPVLAAFARLRVGPAWLVRIASHDLLEAFRRIAPRDLAVSLVLRSGLILVYAVMNHLFTRAFGMPIPIPDLLVYMPILSLVAFIPISVSGLGSTQVLMRRFFAPYVPAALAASEAGQCGIIDAFSTSSILAVLLIRVAIGLACMPAVARMLAAEPDAAQAGGPEGGTGSGEAPA
jgi:uncharacterized membrane protein YbhN (UPF0104 family)